ncbi:hypothetical protein BHE74_00035523, partial [Ensete ventricosum]
SRRKFTGRFAEGIGKLTGNAKGDCREEDRRTCYKIVGVCRSGDQLLTVGKPPRTVGKPPIPKFFGYGWILAPILKPIWGL